MHFHSAYYYFSPAEQKSVGGTDNETGEVTMKKIKLHLENELTVAVTDQKKRPTKGTGKFFSYDRRVNEISDLIFLSWLSGGFRGGGKGAMAPRPQTPEVALCPDEL